MSTRALFLVIAGVFSVVLPASADEVMDVATRSQVSVRLALKIPEQPKAVAVLFAGGNGALLVRSDGSIERGGNSLIKGRGNFAKFGLVAAAMDAASDQLAAHGNMPDPFRQSAEHVADIKAVIAALRTRFNLPVWLVGTSRGSTSVAHAGARLAGDAGAPDGLVLTSSIGVDNTRGGNLLDMDLGAIKGPALVVHHEDDRCNVTPFRGAENIFAALRHAGPVELMRITGGKSGSKVCGPIAHHGFRGQRGKVFKRIVQWIKTH